ncbi:hypothetical protein Hanom_Chr12g01154311 [Helianthus anomalus]
MLSREILMGLKKIGSFLTPTTLTATQKVILHLCKAYSAAVSESVDAKLPKILGVEVLTHSHINT